MNYLTSYKQFRYCLSIICALSLLFMIATQVVKAQAGPFLISPLPLAILYVT